MKEVLEKVNEAAKNSEDARNKKPSGEGDEKQGGSGGKDVDPKERPESKLSREKASLLRKNTSAEVRKEAPSGIPGGVSPAAKFQNTDFAVKVNAPSGGKSGEPAGMKTSLINEEAAPRRLRTEGQLAGGIENKAGTENVNAGRVKGVVKDFSVTGGLGVSGGEPIKEKKHIDIGKEKEEGKKVREGTDAQESGTQVNREVVKRREAVRREERKDCPKPAESGSEKVFRGSEARAQQKARAAPAAAKEKSLQRGAERKEGAARKAQGPRQRAPPAPGEGPTRIYERKPAAKPGSDLSQTRDGGNVLYEGSVFKKRYFLQFLWVKRHFVITKGGGLRYYRGADSARRGEFDMRKEFTEVYKQDQEGLHRYRIVVVSDKEDLLGFDSAESRDEFKYWMDKTML